MIYALRHIPTGKYASKSRSGGFKYPTQNSIRFLVCLEEACFWSKSSFAESSRKHRPIPEEWEIVKFSLIEEK